MTRTWLITGGFARLGRALAVAALEAGDRVVVTSRRPEALADLSTAHAERVLALPLDVTSPSSARDVVAAAVDRFGSLDVVATTRIRDQRSIEDFRRTSSGRRSRRTSSA